MKTKSRSLLSIISTALILASTIVQAGGPYPPPPPPPPPDLNSFSGRAFVVYANVLGLLETTIVDTGELPDIGGVREENLAVVDIGLLRAELLHAKTTGGETLDGSPDPDGAESEAEVAHVVLNLAGIPIEADVIRAMSRAECDFDKPGVVRLSGDSEIQNLKIAGKSVVHVAPNQKTTLNVGLLKVEVVLDEQIKKAFTKDGHPGGEIKVNAVRITVKSLAGVVAKVIISSAKSDIICGLTPTDP